MLDSQNDKFLAGVHPLYQRSFKYGMEKLNRWWSWLKNAVFVEFSKRQNVDLDNALVYVKRFDLNMEGLSVNQLSQEFLDYQLIDNAEIPDSV